MLFSLTDREATLVSSIPATSHYATVRKNERQGAYHTKIVRCDRLKKEAQTNLFEKFHFLDAKFIQETVRLATLAPVLGQTPVQLRKK
jgi:hypothetical protein